MIKGVLFDMDGILFDTERIYLRAEADTITELGFQPPADLASKFCGINSKLFKETIMGLFGPGFPFEEFQVKSRQRWEDALQQEGGPTPLPGVAETLFWLKQNGYKMAVASSTKRPRIDTMLASARFTAFFDAVVGGDMIENGKPAPDIFVHAARQLGLAAEDCAAVEDSYNGIRSASAAGCFTVMVPNMLPATDEMRALSHAVLPSMAELTALLVKENSK